MLVVFVNPPTHSAFLVVLHKSAHPVVFGIIALISLELIRTTDEARWINRYVGALSVVVVSGAATEIAQSWVGRDASALDVVRDAIGGVAVLAIVSVRDGKAQRRGMRTWMIAIAISASIGALAPLAWCVVAYGNRDLQFPTILQYRSPLDLYFVKVWIGNVRGVELPAQWASLPDEKGIEVNLQFWKPGLRLFETYPDWRGYDALLLDVTNPNGTVVDLVVRVNAESPDYCDVQFEVAATARVVLRIQLQDMGKAGSCPGFDDRHVAGMAVFTTRTISGGLLYVDRIWLGGV